MKYSDELNKKVEDAYRLATAAKKNGADPKTVPEVYLTSDVASRVEGLVGPEGVAERIRELQKDNTDQVVALLIAEEIAKGKFGHTEEAAIEQGIRTGLAHLTLGVVAAPREGISAVKIESNADGTNYLSVYYAGPIRSAGGTAQALSILVADHIRKALGIGKYKPYEEEIGRYIEECRLYDRYVRLQYNPSDAQIRQVVENCPVCINGVPTEDIEVSNYRNLSRLSTNRLRGGACLVLAEGIIQKAPKILKRVKKLKEFEFNWNWLEGLYKDKSSEDGDAPKTPKYLNEVPAGRPVFAEPHKPGGFRLRYGRSRTNGFASYSVNPATMIITNEFIATGTQLRVELPGKATAVTSCDTIEGPIVKLRDGRVLQINDVETAEQYRSQVDRILFLGDLLIAYGDFLQNNHELEPAGYCEEWWAQETKDLDEYRKPPYKTPPVEDAIKSTENSNPLHPKYTFFWKLISKEEFESLKEQDWSKKSFDPNLKPIFEKLGVFHTIDDKIHLDDSQHKILSHIFSLKPNGSTPLEALNTKIKIRDKTGTFIGCRMGRPEKAAGRKMSPAPHVLFPTGIIRGRVRELFKASERPIHPELANYDCKNCGLVFYRICPKCGAETNIIKKCPKCGTPAEEKCPVCKIPTRAYSRREVDLSSYLQTAKENIDESVEAIAGTLGMTSENKNPEPLEKGILRSKHNLYVFKDGTIRFDATDVPLTHFRPREIGTTISELMNLGYTHDYLGEPLESPEQILQLKPQDVLLSIYGENNAADIFVRNAQFVDDLLTKYYKTDPYYNVRTKEDLIGHLVLGLAPHTSAAVVGRIIGFTEARVGFAHPYFHATKRRNCDGDEDALMLLMDSLLNFSQDFLPSSVGGSMDAPLILIKNINPEEVDDEVYDLEIVSSYPLDFYAATLKRAHPSEISKKILRVAQVLNKETKWDFTHDTHDINAGPKRNHYTEGAMLEKLRDQLDLATKIDAVDENMVASKILQSHFIPDMKGNLRTFSSQKLRCGKCNAKYRRVPLTGKCTRCGNRLLLTVSKGTVVKYLEPSKTLINQYKVPEYIRQQILLLDKQVDSVLGKEPYKQLTLSEI